MGVPLADPRGLRGSLPRGRIVGDGDPRGVQWHRVPLPATNSSRIPDDDEQRHQSGQVRERDGDTFRGSHLWNISEEVNGARADPIHDGCRTGVPGELESRGVRRVVVEPPIGRVSHDLLQGVGVGDRGPRSQRNWCADQQGTAKNRDEDSEPRVRARNLRQITSGASVDIHALMLPRTALAT